MKLQLGSCNLTAVFIARCLKYTTVACSDILTPNHDFLITKAVFCIIICFQTFFCSTLSFPPQQFRKLLFTRGCTEVHHVFGIGAHCCIRALLMFSYPILLLFTERLQFLFTELGKVSSLMPCQQHNLIISLAFWHLHFFGCSRHLC